MRVRSFLSVALAAVTVALVSCKSVRTAENPARQAGTAAFDKEQFMRKVAPASAGAQCVTSKMRFSLRLGEQSVSLSGNLRMRRDDVVRLQLVAFGLVEAGRMEFTKDYVLIMDRINKQYVKAAYSDVEFLRESGINFYSLQALFWGELFRPGAAGVTEAMLGDYHAYMAGSDVAVMLERGNMTYRWMADRDGGHIKSVNVLYKDSSRGDTRLDWRYGGFVPFGKRLFPTENSVGLTTRGKEIKVEMTLGGIGTDSGWETRTEISGKYRQVSVDEILRRLSSL